MNVRLSAPFYTSYPHLSFYPFLSLFPSPPPLFFSFFSSLSPSFNFRRHVIFRGRANKRESLVSAPNVTWRKKRTCLKIGERKKRAKKPATNRSEMSGSFFISIHIISRKVRSSTESYSISSLIHNLTNAFIRDEVGKEMKNRTYEIESNVRVALSHRCFCRIRRKKNEKKKKN